MLKEEFKYSDSIIKVAIDKIGVDREWICILFSYFLCIFSYFLWKKFRKDKEFFLKLKMKSI